MLTRTSSCPGRRSSSRPTGAQERPLAVINYTKSDRVPAQGRRLAQRRATAGRDRPRLGPVDLPLQPPVLRRECRRPHDLPLPAADPVAGRTRGPAADAPAADQPPVRRQFGAGDSPGKAGWDGGTYVVLGAYPHHRYPGRRWFPVDAPWVRLAQLARAAGVMPVLVGGPEHREALEAIAAQGGPCAWPAAPACRTCWRCSARRWAPSPWIPGSPTWSPPPASPPWWCSGSDRNCWTSPPANGWSPCAAIRPGAPAYPLTPEAMASARLPVEATSTISAERAGRVRTYLASEAPLG